MRFLLWGLLTAFLCVSFKLALVHTSPDSRLSSEEEKHIGEIELRAPRGEIYDRSGTLLATDRRVASLWADPREVIDPEMMAVYLGEKLHVDPQELRDQLARRDEKGAVRKFAWLKRRLTDEEVELLKNLEPVLSRGLNLQYEYIRYYPEGDLAAHTIGYANREGVGCEGVELSFDKYLRCVPGKMKSRVDAKRRILQSLTLEYVEQTGADDITLTLDSAIQRKLEQQLDKALVDSQAPSGMGIVMDPRTGAILAMARRPSYDPNVYWEYDPKEHSNPSIEYVFEPGSAFKIVTASAALEHGLVTPETMINCENGAFNPYGHRIKDFHKLGTVPFTTCFAESSNIATIKVAALLGPERLESWVKRFGFGQPTSPDLPKESWGIVHSRKSWSKLTMGAIPIGQEISVTMPQLARAFCAIANGGFLVEAYLVESASDRDGNVIYRHEAKGAERVMSDQTASTMRDLCHQVVLHGTGKPADIPEYRVCGKTGTAQIARPKELGGGFYPDKYTTIFAGFAPASDPRLCAVIVVQEPAIRLHYGGSVCGPVFKEVVREALTRMDCPLDPVVEEGDVEPAPKEEENDADTMVARLETNLRAIALTAAAADPLDALALCPLDGSQPQNVPTIGNLSGMTKRQAKAYLDTLGIPWDYQGAGRVIIQQPPAGTPLSDITKCSLVFSNQPLEQADASKPDSEPVSRGDRSTS